MHARDRLAAVAVIERMAEILRSELGDDAQALWPVLGALLRQYLNDKPTTITALADLSGLPRTSARRIVFDLKARGLLVFRAVSESGSREVVVPAAALLDRLDRITEQTIRLVMGASDSGGHSVDTFDRFNAERYAEPPGIAWPRPASQGFDGAIELTLVAYEDPVFDILKRNRADIERFVGHRLKILTYPQDAYLSALNHALKTPAHTPMLVAIPFPWLAEFSADGHLRELQDLQAASTLSGADFYDAVWQAGWVNRQLYAIPLQPTVDFLWYRQDLFEAEGLAPPATFDDVIRCAERLQRPSRERAGISWNAAPGLPLAESFLQILGAQGGLRIDDGIPQVDTEHGRLVVDYLRALVPWSSPQLRASHWTRNAQLFGAGKAAMCYHWSNRFGMLDSHALLQKGGRVGLQLHPTFAAGVTPLSPLGGASLAIPSRLADASAQTAWRAIETLTSPELMKYFVLHGAAGSALHAVAEDRYVRQRNRVIAEIDRLARNRQIRTCPFPAIAGYQRVTQQLSDHLTPLIFDGATDIRRRLGRLQSALARAHAKRK
ncbi:extracellular solute-binding protein [Burkholderia sp. Ax-1719]|uniref:extracellular solute-binding protein n=1 Tax=Burkholderia sp. Ax-1719 TaxID=2608334 RepID=UPI00141E7F72|nr:extracellular solute-binding protein [Burkholderia sp. Ax-1719]NIE62373.1 extracellular solute-binding protein [Burkholderia sp. Ax-1719]